MQITKDNTRMTLALFASALILVPGYSRASPPRSFSDYVLKAVTEVEATESGLGYLKSASFSKDLPWDERSILKSANAPYTMCVSASLEIIVRAIDIYFRETGDRSPYDFLPIENWQKLRPVDLRGQIWLVAKSGSNGTAHALEKFGMGEAVDFRNISPGAFVNLNRNNATGHAVVFMGYLDGDWKIHEKYDWNIGGFKYFSSQGNLSVGGF